MTPTKKKPKPPTPEEVAAKKRKAEQGTGNKVTATRSAVPSPENPKSSSDDFRALKTFDSVDLKIAEQLPPPIYLGQLIRSDPERPPELISGLLGRGSKCILTGSSKSYKTFTLLGQALSIAAGQPWWDFETVQGTVLYLNFEIQDYYFLERIYAIEERMGVQIDPKRFIYWGLRGHASAFVGLADKVMRATCGHEITNIYVDPIYKGMAGFDESKSGDVSKLMEQIDRVISLTGAAVTFGHHHSKGNQAAKEAMDASSGSGVWSRDPDTIITMRPHKDPSGDVYCVDAIVRNFQRIEPFCVRWDYPLMVRDDTFDPAELKERAKTSGGGRFEEKFSDEALLKLLDDEPLSSSKFQKTAKDEIGISATHFYRRRAELEDSGLIIRAGKEWIRAGGSASLAAA